jgi:hypothetical protein
VVVALGLQAVQANLSFVACCCFLFCKQQIYLFSFVSKFGAGVLLFLQIAIQLCGLNLWWRCLQTLKVLSEVLVLFVIAESALWVFVVLFVVLQIAVQLVGLGVCCLLFYKFQN